MTKELYFLDQTVRVTELNYGNHLGMTQFQGMGHNARYAYFESLGLSECDVGDGSGIMVIESNMKLKSESLHGDVLRFFVSLKPGSKAQFKCEMIVKNAHSGKLVGIIDEIIVCYNFSTKRLSPVPESLKQHFQ